MGFLDLITNAGEGIIDISGEIFDTTGDVLNITGEGLVAIAKGENVLDTIGKTVISATGEIIDGSGNVIGRVLGRQIFDADDNFVGFIDELDGGPTVFSKIINEFTEIISQITESLDSLTLNMAEMTELLRSIINSLIEFVISTLNSLTNNSEVIELLYILSLVSPLIAILVSLIKKI